MSHSASVTKIFFDPSQHKTPNAKELSQQNGNEIFNPPILMDEFGQTPDHFYLARKNPSVFQVRRKLNLQKTTPTCEDGIRKTTRRIKRKVETPPKEKKVVTRARYDTSLGQLTKKFLKLLSDAADGVINLNTACTLLSVPKRRLYDITNVLEGAGLIQKTSRNNIQWMGRVSTAASSAVMCDLEKEIDVLEAKENKLDELIYHMKSEIKAIREFEGEYLYVTSDELKNVEEFSTKTLVGVKLGSGEQVVDSSDNTIILSSKTSELAAFLLAEDVSFVNILHTAEFKENSYQVQICNSRLAGFIKEEVEEQEAILETDNYGYENVKYDNSTFAQLCSGSTWTEVTGLSLPPGAGWSEGHLMKDAFIADEDDIAPLSRNFLLQTEDQDLELPFPNLELEDSYSFSLDAGEGLSDLFDCHFSCP